MILFSVVFRVLVALFTQSYFQPDEYFQGLEPAHKYVFGYGHLTWEWVNPEPLRSMLYPALNVPVYWLLKVSGLDVYPLLVVGFGTSQPTYLISLGRRTKNTPRFARRSNRCVVTGASQRSPRQCV